ncbi:MAG TPA: GtrA family protein [Acidobacteriaceae bacterium]|nr:GtrA family protein [Acidobacteriaceae bacterium]
MSVLVRWLRFNGVGAMGTAVQLGVLALLNHLWRGHYMWASATALEVTLLHNFAWHRRFTWRDRCDEAQERWRQLLRFHLSNGLVSLVGNLGLMRMLVAGAHTPAVAANAVAIVGCSLLNYSVGNRWVFAEQDGPVRQQPMRA